MKRFQQLLLTLTGILIISAVHSQTSYEPSILILTPNETTADKSLIKKIKKYESEIKDNQQKVLEESKKALTRVGERDKNIKIMFEKKVAFIEDMGFYSIIPSIAEGYLQYRFFERFKNLLIYATNERSKGSVDALSTLASNHEVQYVLNFPKVNSYVEKGKKKSTITVQLFDNLRNEILFEKEFTGIDENPGFEFSCGDGTLQCTFNNALSEALREVIYIVAANNPTIIKEKRLAKERAELLLNKYYPSPPALEIIEIISENDTTISTDGFYHGFLDESKTKFIGFFAYNSSASNFSDIKDSEDRNVQILTSDFSNLDEVPKIYAYIALGILHDNKWYIDKKNATYFNAEDLETGRMEYFNNLQKWHFFKTDSSEFDPEFWETYFFSKMESSVEQNKDKIEEYSALMNQAEGEDKEIYQDMIDRFYEDDLKSEGYFGLYSIVASELKESERAESEKFELNFSETVLTPFFNDYIKMAKLSIVEYKKLNGKNFALIYPRDKQMILCPIVFNYKNDKSELHYFVALPAENGEYKLYKWKYFKPVAPEYKAMYGSDINEQLNTITSWNFSFDYLEDGDFWEKYVLKKSGESYEYLEEVRSY